MDELKASPETFARREAQPIQWDQLDEHQQEAARLTCRILADLAGRPSPPAKQAKGLDLFLPTIDAERLNHVILLDGDRGSGKTALLVTLIDGFSRALRDDDKELHGDFRKMLESTKKVVPIGLIDLQPLPSSTNLPLFLVGRFQHVVEAIEQESLDRGDARGHRREDRAPWQGIGPEEPACTARWRDFLQAAALGWSDGLDRRRANLDPEAFALELEQAERRRLDVVSSFRALIDALVKDYELLRAAPRNGPPLFLLAVDDADMNPSRAAELLDLVRTLWHPRVAFLLTGDTDLFRATLRRRLKKKIYTRPAGTFLDDLVNDIYNKVIPPTHRGALPSLSPSQRFSRLNGWLKKLTTPADPIRRHAETLDKLFDASEQLCEALPSRARSIADLRLRIDADLATFAGPDGPERDKAARSTIAAICRAAYIPWEEEQGRRWPDGDVEENLLHVARTARGFSWSASTRNAYYFDNSDNNDKNWDLIVQSHVRWDAFQDQKPVPDKVVAASMLASDVADGLTTRRGVLRPLAKLGLLGAPARIQYRSGDDVHSFAWPLPDWPSFADYAAFGKRWVPEREDLQKVSLGGRVNHLAQKYLGQVIAQIRGEKLKQADVPGGKRLTELKKFAELVAEIASAQDKNPIGAAWALGRAGLFAAPESGLSAEAANEWLEALKSALGERWEVARHELKKERRARVNKTLPDGALQVLTSSDGLLKSIDERWGNYKWKDIVEHDPPRVRETSVDPKPLLDLLEQISTRPGAVRKTLGAYFNLPRRTAALVTHLTRARMDALLTALEPYRNREGAAEEAAVVLWETLGRSDNVSSDLVAFREGRIDIPSLINRSGEPFRLDIRGVDWASYTDGDLQIRRCWLAQAGNEKPSPSAVQRAVFNVVFDVKIDAEDADPSWSARVDRCCAPWWRGVGSYFSSAPAGYLWPAPGWPATYEWESLTSGWDQVVARATAIGGNRGDLIRNQQIVDGLAEWFINAVKSTFFSGPIVAPIKINGNPGAAMPEFNTERGNTGTARERAYHRWCNDIYVLGAPESGLSVEAGDAIIKTLGLRSNWQNFIDLQNLKPVLERARLDRAMASGLLESQARQHLSEIDGNNPDHPWVQTFRPFEGP